MPGEWSEPTLLWPVLTPLGFLLLAALIIVLGASSTAKYEFERNLAQAARRQATVGAAAGHGDHSRSAVGGGGDAAQEVPAQVAVAEAGVAEAGAGEAGVGVAVVPVPAAPSVAAPVPAAPAHPAGRHRVDPAAEPAWWLVEDDGTRSAPQVVAGPFDDRVDADWAALSTGLAESVIAVHGVQRADGGLVRRQSPEEQAWLRELGGQLDRLPEDWDELLSDDDALTTLVVEVAAVLVEAGLPVHDCAGADRSGGVCLTPGPNYGGVVVSWHQHERSTGRSSGDPTAVAAVQETMDAAVFELLAGAGFELEPFGTGGGVLVTDLLPHLRGAA